ncbi:hypothetical protein ACH5RR_026294 [Cinchona calisaya]|uniref:Uncharacterized protein n=1 Tax=Cinchona calisaya TaxID=153742 RepID=A0ABD2Z5D5_9GENT
MAKVNKVQRKSRSRARRVTPYSSSSCFSKFSTHTHQQKGCGKTSEKLDWEDATCSVCMEFPHNAVLLLCSSHGKGCHPFMCATSYRYSNCLEQYRKAYTKVISSHSTLSSQGSFDDSNFTPVGCNDGKTELPELLCPLCRGQVKGWTVVETARKYLNAKKRTCMQDSCSFAGSYKELRKHVRVEHPSICPQEVDPSLAEKWKKLENDRELNDVFSTIRSTMPGAIVMGDYVIESNFHDFDRDYEMNDYLDGALLRLESYSRRWNDGAVSRGVFEEDYHSLDEEDYSIPRSGPGASSGNTTNYISRISRYGNRLLLGRSRRRRRHRTGHRAR